MSRDPQDHPATGEELPADLESLLENPMRRADLFKGAGKLGLGALSVGGLGSLIAACGGSSSSDDSAAAGGAGGKAKKVAVIEQAFSPFFTENFQNPAKDYLQKNQPGWSVTFGNENNTVPTGINLLNQYAANNYGLTILSTGDEMSAWERAVKQTTSKGTLFINHSTQGVAGATQNVLFSHKQAGVDVGNAAVDWAKKNNVSKPVVALIGNLSDAQGKKRTEWAWKTIKAKMPSATLAGQAQGIDAGTGGPAAANLLSAHPDINMLITFNTLAGVAAMTSAHHAGKNDRNSFFLGTTDSEEQTLKLIADANTIYQANWGAFFPASMVLMLRDGINKMKGKAIKPTRLILGLTIVTPEQAKSFNTIAFNPLEPKYQYVLTKYFKYLDTPTGTAEVPPGQ